MNILKQLEQRQAAIAVVGLGYVGLPLAVAFSTHFNTIGFDLSEHKINIYRQGKDPTCEVGDMAIQHTSIHFTCQPAQMSTAAFFVIAVPTPIHGDKTPDLTSVKKASQLVGQYLTQGSVVVYESTVYPGVTEDICRPILEEVSGMQCGPDFKIAYSPERINPGDTRHRLTNIVKIVSGMDAETLDVVAAVYEKIIDAGVYRAPTIQVAEAAKLVENAQRDINIAFMNELAMVFHRMNIETAEVIKAMNTKWNALGFTPGLVGGHCIGVDPYYFIYQAGLLGYHSQIIASGRRVNDTMSEFIAQEIIKTLIRSKINVCHASIYLMGITFKEDCPDTRNSKPMEVYRWLEQYGLSPKLVDPQADPAEVEKEFHVCLTPMSEVQDADCLVFLVAHREFRRMNIEDINLLYKDTTSSDQKRVLLDVKSIFSSSSMQQSGYVYWNL